MMRHVAFFVVDFFFRLFVPIFLFEGNQILLVTPLYCSQPVMPSDA